MGHVAFDAYAPRFQEDPYSTYARLREANPVFFDETWGLTFFTRNRDVNQILKDRQHFGRDFRHRLSIDEVDPDLYRRIYPPQWPTWTRYIRESFIDLEPPRHTRLRRLVSAAFTRRSSEAFRPELESATDSVLDSILSRGGDIEVLSEFATPIPLTMIASLMGIPSSDHSLLVGWSHDIVKVFDERVTPEEGEQAERATEDFVAYLRDLVATRRRDRGDDLISAMLSVDESGDSLTEEEVVGTSILTLNAGHEATVHAIGNSLLALSKEPGLFESIRQRSLPMSRVVDELLRWDSPLQMFERWVLDECEVGGQRLTPGSKVGLLFGSANHDEEVFGPTASRVVLDRNPNPHLSFGAGLHHCVGAPLARVELEAALGRLVARVRSIDLISVSERIESLVFRGVGHLSVQVEPA